MALAGEDVLLSCQVQMLQAVKLLNIALLVLFVVSFLSKFECWLKDFFVMCPT
jgi:hypothetical protein